MAILPDDGLIISLLGGTRSHVGAVGVGVPRASLRDPATTSATSSVITLTGHKEDAIAKAWAEEAARRLGMVAVVVAGIHIDDAPPDDMEALVRNANEAMRVLLEELQYRISSGGRQGSSTVPG